MAIAERRIPVIPLNFAARSHDGGIVLGYAAFAAIALAAIFMAGAVAIWTSSPKPAAATANATLSPYELQLQTDIKTLPELKTDGI